jgi:hypothetical protein
MEQIKNFYGSIQIMVLVPQLQSTSSTQFIGANFSATPHQDGCRDASLNHRPPSGFRFGEASSDHSSWLSAGQPQVSSASIPISLCLLIKMATVKQLPLNSDSGSHELDSCSQEVRAEAEHPGWQPSRSSQ